ncbi:hypothetical protein R5R35_003904 [Gryllus longicercus]
MQRHHGIKPADCIAELELCVRDGLLHFERTVGKKGSKKGSVQERYVVPTKPLRDGHDWYCFECHKGGEVKCCSSCHRVFHTYCVKDLEPGNLLCYICIAQQDPISITKEKLNQLLGYLHRSMKDLVPANLKKWSKSLEDELAMKALLYNPVDLNTIQKKILAVHYSHWLEFAADVKNFVHNILIYFGERSSYTQQIIKMVEYCLHDIKEIEKCADCYEASNDRADKLWFCKPCKPLHRLVFAKLEAFPFWPAKVITHFDDKYDVRFFGSGHTRSVVSKAHVKTIPFSIKYIENLPKYGNTLSWEKAMKELIFHIICIGPRIILKRLPSNYHEKELLQTKGPNPQRITKRKMCDDITRNKKSRCHEEIGNNKTPNVYKSCDKRVRKSIECDTERCKVNVVDRNICCDDGSSEQPVITKDTQNFQSPLNTDVQETEMQEVDLPGKTDVRNIASRSETDSDSVSISELHEEIDIKDEYVEEYQVVQIESTDISETNGTFSKRNSERVEASSSNHALLKSAAQQIGTHQIDVPKKGDSVAHACQSEMQSDSVAFTVLNDGVTTKKKPEDGGKHQLINAKQVTDSGQKSNNIQNLGNSAEKYACCSKNDSDSLEILAESIIVKEEPPCLHCSGLDMIPRKEAEKLKEEAVAQTTKHFLAIIARLEEQCTKTNAEKLPSNGI